MCLTLCDAMNRSPAEFSRQEYWSGLPCPPLEDFPNPGLDSYLSCLLHWRAGSLPLAPSGKSLKQEAQMPNCFTIFVLPGLLRWWFLSLLFFFFFFILKGQVNAFTLRSYLFFFYLGLPIGSKIFLLLFIQRAVDLT